uniref:dynein heavy chain 12, axonemal-like n=1 Tax=Monopterus albus TaxID=43700 RepID=UPI0009B334AB
MNEQIAAARAIAETIAVDKKLLKHRRSKVQQEKQHLILGLLPEMATSPGVSKASTSKGMTNFPVLPPIEPTQIAAARAIAETIAVDKKLLKHRRSKVQQEKQHLILVSRAMEAYKESQEKRAVHSELPEPEFPPSMLSEECKRK